MTALITQLDTRLQTELTNFATVAKAWTTEPIENFNSESPACLYYLAGISSEASPYDTQDYQPGDRNVGVLLVCPAADFETRWQEINAAVAGWQPTGDTYETFEHISGETLAIYGDLLWWRDTYAVRCYRGEI